jgi:hypothetical protein
VIIFSCWSAFRLILLMIVEDVGFAFYFTYPQLCEVYFFNIE